MLVIITYDVNTQNSAGKKRLRNVAKVCVNYGQRVQNSVFECVMDQAKCREVKHKLTGLIDKEHDKLSLASMLKKMFCLYELFCANRKLT